MKKFLVLLVCLCACVATSFAQKGESALGVNLNYGDEFNFGMGVKYRYSFTDNWRIEPAVNYYFKHDHLSMWDLGANMHYVIPVAQTVSFYPLAGLGYARVTAHTSDLGREWNNLSSSELALNLGAGVDFKIASNMKLNVEAKYQIIDNVNQFVVAAGLSFAF